MAHSVSWWSCWCRRRASHGTGSLLGDRLQRRGVDRLMAVAPEEQLVSRNRAGTPRRHPGGSGAVRSTLRHLRLPSAVYRFLQPITGGFAPRAAHDALDSTPSTVNSRISVRRVRAADVDEARGFNAASSRIHEVGGDMSG